MRITRFHAALLIAVTTVLAGGAGRAMADPPLRAGRLSYVEGKVSLRTIDTNQWVPATLNIPVSDGAWFWTDAGSRAEIEIGPTAIRTDESTEIGILRLDQGATRLQVPQGVVNVSLREIPIGGLQIETPRGEVSLLQPGRYHLEAVPAGPDPAYAGVQLTVLAGDARIDGPNVAMPVHAGQTVRIGGYPARVSLSAAVPSAFDAWALERDRQKAAALASQYVSPYMTGYQDLDVYGRWTRTADYGAVWFPTAVAAGWAPYRFGHWAYIPPWGWTWIDDTPWGFAPFHYGRWIFLHGAWGWCPGERVRHPVYAPALVAFIGGNGWSLTITAGQSHPAVGWVPLGPREAFHPYYTASVGYLHAINRPYLDRTAVSRLKIAPDRTDVSGYRNFHATTIVPTNAFTAADPVQRHTLAWRREQLTHARGTSIEHLQPTPAARFGGRRAEPDGTTRTLSPAPVQRTRESTRRQTSAPATLGTPASTTAPKGLQTRPSAGTRPRETPRRSQTAPLQERRRQPASSGGVLTPEKVPRPAVTPAPIPSQPSGFQQRSPTTSAPTSRERSVEPRRTPSRAPSTTPTAPAIRTQRSSSDHKSRQQSSSPSTNKQSSQRRTSEKPRPATSSSGGSQTSPRQKARSNVTTPQDRQTKPQSTPSQGFGTKPQPRQRRSQDDQDSR